MATAVHSESNCKPSTELARLATLVATLGVADIWVKLSCGRREEEGGRCACVSPIQVCVCVRARVRVCVCTYTLCTYTTYDHVRMCACLCVRVSVCVCIHIMYICICVTMSVCVHVCVYPSHLLTPEVPLQLFNVCVQQQGKVMKRGGASEPSRRT